MRIVPAFQNMRGNRCACGNPSLLAIHITKMCYVPIKSHSGRRCQDAPGVFIRLLYFMGYREFFLSIFAGNSGDTCSKQQKNNHCSLRYADLTGVSCIQWAGKMKAVPGIIFKNPSMCTPKPAGIHGKTVDCTLFPEGKRHIIKKHAGTYHGLPCNPVL